MKTYVTFGQIHTHSVNGKTLDKDCVAVIECKNAEDGRTQAFEFFGKQFCMEYPEDKFDFSSMCYFHRGLININ